MTTILGAGLSGCLAGIVIPDSVIFEARDEESFMKAPEHKAVLRFRSDRISRLTGIPFQKVQVRKSIWSEGKEYRLPDIRLTNMYSKKVSGGYTDRSIVNLDTVERWIPPEDFHKQLLLKVRGSLNFGLPVIGITRDSFTYRNSGDSFETTRDRSFETTKDRGTSTGPIISTLPIPVLSKILQLPCPLTSTLSSRVYVIRYRIKNCNLNLSMYYPDLETPVYRASIMKDILAIEMMENKLRLKSDVLTANGIDYFLSPRALPEVFHSLGIDGKDTERLDEGSQLGKISYNLSERERKAWILKLTLEYGIYSLGRFAIWKNILQDDVYDDVHKIRDFISSGSHYDFYRETARTQS